MQRLFLLIIIQLAFLTSVEADQSPKAVKSDLLRAIHANNTNEIRRISTAQKRIVHADPVLQRMVDAYFEEEARALEELKETARLKREREAKELAEAIAAKKAEEKRKLLMEQEQKHVEETTVADAVVEIPKPTPSVTSTEKKRVTKSVEKKKADEPKPAPQKKLVEKKQPVKKATSKKTSRITMSKVDIAGQWKADKKAKKVMFKAFKDGHFKLEERSGEGILLLEGSYVQKGEELILDIEKITYNVRSREAAVQRIYQLKALSTRQIVLVDEKGEVAYTFRR